MLLKITGIALIAGLFAVKSAPATVASATTTLALAMALAAVISVIVLGKVKEELEIE